MAPKGYYRLPREALERVAAFYEDVGDERMHRLMLLEIDRLEHLCALEPKEWVTRDQVERWRSEREHRLSA